MKLPVKIFSALSVFLYQLSDGVLGSRMAGQSMLLLFTTGRKSGKIRITPISYFRDGETYILIASNWGRDYHPGWYYNLISQPEAEIQVKARKLRVCSHLAVGEEYDRLWNYVASQSSFYTRYQQRTRRKIPVVVLVPES
jgi:F420H(2)-dependent quinone reductase